MLTRGAATRSARGVFKIGMLVIGLSVPSVIHVMRHAMLSEFTPVPQRGAMLAITNAVWTLAGLPAPYLKGWVIEGAATAAEGYQRGFALSGAMTLIGGRIGLAFSRPGKGNFPLRLRARPGVGRGRVSSRHCEEARQSYHPGQRGLRIGHSAWGKRTPAEPSTAFPLREIRSESPPTSVIPPVVNWSFIMAEASQLALQLNTRVLVPLWCTGSR
jgi:hypothetical protein